MKKIVQISVIVVLAALLLVGGILAVNLYTRPMAEPMKVQIPEVQPTATAVQATAVAVAEQAKPAQKTETCGQTGEMRLLFVGAHHFETGAPIGAESVRLVKVDYDQKRVVVVVFPRDLLLKTPSLADLNISETRLGPAYRYEEAATQGDVKHQMTKATELVAQALYDNFAYPEIKKDYYYFDVRVDEMGKMVDTIGGVEVTLDQGFTNERNVTFKSGTQTLNGDLSIQFVNSLQPGGDRARIARQNLFAKALQTKALSTNILTKLPDLYKQFDQAIVTDLSPKQIEALACMAKGDPQVKIEIHEISVEHGLVTAGTHGELIPDTDNIKAALKDWFAE